MIWNFVSFLLFFHLFSSPNHIICQHRSIGLPVICGYRYLPSLLRMINGRNWIYSPRNLFIWTRIGSVPKHWSSSRWSDHIWFIHCNEELERAALCAAHPIVNINLHRVMWHETLKKVNTHIIVWVDIQGTCKLNKLEIYCWLLEFYVLATSKVISGRVPICDSAHSWRLYSAVPPGNQAVEFIVIRH